MKFIAIVIVAFTLMGCPGKKVCTTEKPCISNTTDFINSFNAIQNVRTYQALKDSAYNLARSIKNNENISEDKKILLKGYYTDMYDKSEEMYNSIVVDLTTPEKRRYIKDNFLQYVQSLNNQFDAIKTSNQTFVNQHRTLTKSDKGFLPAWLVNTVLWPVAKAFINEVINDQTKKALDNYLRPMLVLKSWENI